MIKKLSIDRLNDWFALISQEAALYLPVDQGGQAAFGPWSPEARLRLDDLNTNQSPKELFFPQSENLVAFKTQGKSISVIDQRKPTDPFVVFGLRACDAASIEILDRVFLSEPVDSYYAARREAGILVTRACFMPEETCFCGAFGIDAMAPAGDIATWEVERDLYLQARTPKGRALLEKSDALLCDTDEEPLQAAQAAARALYKQLPLANLSLDGLDGDATLRLFDAPQWATLSESCIACGTCTFVCPTCQCYDIRDYDTGNGIQRYRCWDSCMYSDFTRMAHGNPRTSQRERFRQRFMHKLVYFPANNGGTYSCVGCGRCLVRCPVSMNIAKVIKTLGVKTDG